MSEIGKLFVTLGAKTDKSSFDKTKNSINHLKIALAAVVAAGAAFTAFVLKAASAAGKQEQAELKLATALKTAKDNTNISIGALTRYASELQNMTTIGDETILGVMQLGLSMGVSAGKIRNATTGAVGLSKAFNIDLNTSMKMVALALEGNYDLLTRYIPELRSASTETEKAAILNKAMANGFDLAKAEAGTYAGKVEQLKNRFGDLIENIGFVFIPTLNKLVDFINRNILPALESIVDKIRKLQLAIGVFKALINAYKNDADEYKKAQKDKEKAAIEFNDLTIEAAEKAADERLKKLKKLDREEGAAYRRLTKKIKDEYDNQVKAAQEAFNKILETASAVMAQVHTIISNYSMLRIAGIQNELNASIESENANYETKRQYIMDNITDETERDIALQELEEGHAARVENLRTQAEARERAMRKRLKPLLIAEAVAGTALAVINALNTQPFFPLGIIMGVLAAAAGAMQIAVIKAQNFAKGGMVNRATAAIFGEAGQEVALPLNNPLTIRALSGALQNAFAYGGAGGGYNINVVVPPIGTRQEARRMGEIVGDAIYRKVRAGRKI